MSGEIEAKKRDVFGESIVLFSSVKFVFLKLEYLSIGKSQI